MTIATHGAIVIGAGVAGLSTALYLQRAGVAVAVIDPLGPAGGASFGNAGLLSPDTAVPIALPGMLRKVPGWLTDPPSMSTYNKPHSEGGAWPHAASPPAASWMRVILESAASCGSTPFFMYPPRVPRRR